MLVYFEDENNSFWAAPKLARGAGPEPACALAAATYWIRVQAPIERQMFIFLGVSYMGHPS